MFEDFDPVPYGEGYAPMGTGEFGDSAADPTVPHTQDLVEPLLCHYMWSNYETSWYCEEDALPGEYYCRAHIVPPLEW